MIGPPSEAPNWWNENGSAQVVQVNAPAPVPTKSWLRPL